MKQRCYNPNQIKYSHYGGRGIKICNEWKNSFKSFEQWALQNGYKDNLTIDRIDVDKDYEPLNCRWADWKTQENNRTNNVYIEYQGQKKTPREWGNILNIDRDILYDRIFMYDWSIERAFTQPIRTEIKIEFNNEIHTLKQWSEILQINHDTLYDRIYRNQWSIEKAFTTPTKSQEKILTYNNENLNIQQWADRLGVQRHVIECRLKRGWTIKDALMKPTRNYNKNKEDNE